LNIRKVPTNLQMKWGHQIYIVLGMCMLRTQTSADVS
jgi:hypothetical protein